jgi:hypothetical protein
MNGKSHRPPKAIQPEPVNRTYCQNDHVSPYTARRTGYCAASTPNSATTLNQTGAVMNAEAMITTSVTCAIRRRRAIRSSGSAGSSIARRIARPLHHAYAAGAATRSSRNQ